MSKTVDRSPIALGSSASHSQGTLKAQSSNLDITNTVRPVARGLNANTASSSQVWYSDVNSNTNVVSSVAETTKKPFGTTLSHHILDICRNNVGHLEKVCSNVRKKLGRQPRDDMPEIDVNAMMWRIFMSSTVKAAVHLGQDHREILTYHQEQ